MTTTHWEFIAESLREELADYGGLLRLFEQQQQALFDRDANAVLLVANEIEAQTRTLGESRARREQAVATLAERHDRPLNSSLRAMLPLIEADARPLLEALINEVNALLHRVRRTSRHNHSMLSRTVELNQELMQQLRPNAFTRTYSRRAASPWPPRRARRRSASRAEPEPSRPHSNMPGLFGSLHSTVMALNAHSRAIEASGKNLANVNNPNYARQRVIYGDRGTVATTQGAESLGLEALGVEQLRDGLLDRQVLRESALSASFTAEQNAYERAQAALGQSIDRAQIAGSTNSVGGNGIGAALDDFFNSFQGFAARPTDSGDRQKLLQSASILSDRFELADQRLAQVQTDLNAQVASDVSDVNSLLTTIADLNNQIGRFESNAPGSAVDLRDQRQARLEDLAKKLPVEVTDSGGQIQISVRDGSGSSVVLVDRAQLTAPIAFDGTSLTAGSSTALSLGGGSIKGCLTGRDGGVQTLRNDLDQLVRQLVTSVNGVYNPTGATANFFAVDGTTAGTLHLDPALTAANLKASEGGAAGDNTLALSLAGLSSVVFSTASGDHIDGSFSSFFSQSVRKLGQALAGANSRVADQSNIETLVRSQRDGVSGVSIDEEMADLMKYQRAFQASSRVFTVVDDLLDVVVNRLGH
jgi:flagellar hook-associated protein 1 FlgK